MGARINIPLMIVVTSGPGLKGGLLVGVIVCKNNGKHPEETTYWINHLEGHVLTIWMIQK